MQAYIHAQHMQTYVTQLHYVAYEWAGWRPALGFRVVLVERGVYNYII